MNTVTSSSGSHGRTCKRCGAPYRLWSWQRAMGSGLCVTCTKADKKPLQKPIWEREITSREDALKAVKVAAFCYFGLALLDFIIARFGEPSLDVTAAVIAVCAPLVWLCHSRAAAVVLLGLFVFDVIVTFISQINAPKGTAPFVSFPLLLLQAQITIQAVKATFKLHKQFGAPSDNRLCEPAAAVNDSFVDTLALPVMSQEPRPLPTEAARDSFAPPALENVQPASVTSASLPNSSSGKGGGVHMEVIAKKIWNLLLRLKENLRAVPAPMPGLKDSVGHSGTVWNPLAVAAWSLVFTPLFGSVLLYLNWSRLGRQRRARSVAPWFWGSLVWVVFSLVAPPAFLPPLWAYLVFLGAWIGLVAYPQHLSFANKFAGIGYRRASWLFPIATASACLLPLVALHTAFAWFYRPPSMVPKPASIAAAAASASTPAIDEATRLFSAEEVTQRYRPRIVEVAVGWKVSSGFWFWKSEDPAGSRGSGLLLANDSTAGLIVTNFHVVAAPDSIVDGSYQCSVRQDASQSYIEARCIARARPPLDLALLAVEMNAKEWEPDAVPIQPLDNLHQGEAVVVIGNALGEGISTTNGVISHFDTLDSQGHRCVRTSAPISPENSGGPLFTSRGGFFAGITTATRTEEGAQNYNMAIPAEYVLDVGNWDFANSEAREIAEPLLKAADNREHR